jgi:hypothetical protein
MSPDQHLSPKLPLQQQKREFSIENIINEPYTKKVQKPKQVPSIPMPMKKLEHDSQKMPKKYFREGKV